MPKARVAGMPVEKGGLYSITPGISVMYRFRPADIASEATSHPDVRVWEHVDQLVRLDTPIANVAAMPLAGMVLKR